MAKSAIELARELVEGEPGGLEELRIHEFTSDEDVHDDSLHDGLHADFSADFDRIQVELTGAYGEPSRTGQEDDELIPLNGVFRFAVWEVGGRILFAAAAHEDRDCPMVIVLGTASGFASR